MYSSKSLQTMIKLSLKQSNNTVFKGQVLVFWNFSLFIEPQTSPFLIFFLYLLQKLTLDTQYYLTIFPLVITIFEIV